ncbi:MAG: PHP domain-containing protein [Alistipes shahii]
MKKLLFLAAALSAACAASAQGYYTDAYNPDITRHTGRIAAQRAEFILPEVNGYNVYKADLHTHSVYSDGDCTPEFRVREAWYDGLDVLAITEHVEYRRHEGKMLNFLKGYVPEGTEAINNNIIRRSADEQGIQSDLNLPVKLARETARKYGLTIIPGAEITRETDRLRPLQRPFHHGQQLPLRHRRPAIAPQRQGAGGAGDAQPSGLAAQEPRTPRVRSQSLRRRADRRHRNYERRRVLPQSHRTRPRPQTVRVGEYRHPRCDGRDLPASGPQPQHDADLRPEQLARSAARGARSAPHAGLFVRHDSGRRTAAEGTSSRHRSGQRCSTPTRATAAAR